MLIVAKKLEFVYVYFPFNSKLQWNLPNPPWDLKTKKGMIMKFAPDIGTAIKAQNQNFFWYIWPGL